MTRAKWLSDGYRALLMVRSTGWTCVRPSNDLLKFDAQPKHFVISGFMHRPSHCVLRNHLSLCNGQIW